MNIANTLCVIRLIYSGCPRLYLYKMSGVFPNPIAIVGQPFYLSQTAHECSIALSVLCSAGHQCFISCHPSIVFQVAKR